MIYLIIKVNEVGRPSVELLHGNRAEAEKKFIKLFAEHCPAQAEITAPSTLLANGAFSYGAGSMHLLTVDTNDNPVSRLILSLIDAVDERGLNANSCPVEAPEWDEMGEVYMHACAVMGVAEKRT